MKVLHLCLACFFPDNYSYQENMLPKFHKESGCEVEVIASLETFDEKGRFSYLEKGSEYINEHGIKVTRLDYKAPVKLNKKLKSYKGTYEAIERAKPDVIFIHGCQFCDMKEVVRYLKSHRNVKVYCDNHADFGNSASNFISEHILHRGLWKKSANSLLPYCEKFYGVLPARVDFLKDVYKLPEDKCELLVMGADDELVTAALDGETRKKMRDKYGYSDDDFVVLTGGKIDPKKKIDTLMEAVGRISDKNVKLLVFGPCVPEIADRVKALAENPAITHIGKIPSHEAYSYLAMADLAVFPGLHSVMWEQAVGMGCPSLFHRLDGFTHVDVGGNCWFIDDISADSLKNAIEAIVSDKDDYSAKKKAALDKGVEYFSYREIARRSINL